LAIVADFVGFGRDLQDIFDRVRAEDDGAVATYIPQLARVAPESYGAAVCTI